MIFLIFFEWIILLNFAYSIEWIFFEWIFWTLLWIEYWTESFSGPMQWKNEFSKKIAHPCVGEELKKCYTVMCLNIVLSIFCVHCIVHMYTCKRMLPWWKGKSRCIHLSAHIVPSDQTSWDLFLTNICDWIRRICKSDILNSFFLAPLHNVYIVQYISRAIEQAQTYPKICVAVSHSTNICPSLFDCTEQTFALFFVIFKL